jgi:capsular exopolysaccharide synthesis family protein
MSAPATLRGTTPVPEAFAAADGARSREADRSTLDARLVSLVAPDSFGADQYRVLGHYLEAPSGPAARRVFGVTSPAAGDGKTTTAVNLAATFGQRPGARVLLVDMDLRRPFVAARLGLDDSGAGLADLVQDPTLDLRALARPTSFGFHVVLAGVPAAGASRVFDSPRLGQLLAEARRDYDHVVLDTPPLLLAPESRVISQWVDGYLLVVAAHRTPRALVADSLDAVAADKVLGLVFNGDDRPLSGYFRRYQGYYQPALRARRRRFPWSR